eukprot:jgi/Mesen1/4904/ME000244S04073
MAALCQGASALFVLPAVAGSDLARRRHAPSCSKIQPTIKSSVHTTTLRSSWTGSRKFLKHTPPNPILRNPHRRSLACPRAEEVRPSSGGSAPGSTSVLEKEEEGVAENGSVRLGWSPELAKSLQKADAGEKFDWNAHWYPMAIVADLQKDRPHAITILGHPLVAWWDKVTDKWQVFLDMCPHRLAPLSEGRIHESGALQCSYHGWTFTASGSCSSIPQAPASTPDAHRSPRACAKVYPSREHQGMLWVWPSSDPAAAALAASTAPPTIPELDDPTFAYDLNGRDMPYSYETLIENLMDPAHVPFAHHKIMSNRNLGKPISLSVEKITANGYTGQADRGPATFYGPILFKLDHNLPPAKKKDNILSSLTRSQSQVGTEGANKASPVGQEEGALRGQVAGREEKVELKEAKEEGEGVARRMVMLFYCVPVAPGKSKAFFAFPRNFATQIHTFIPRWLFHLGQLTILDSDLYFLHQQERRLDHVVGGTQNYFKACYMPTASDGQVSAFRRWLNSYAGGGPAWGPGVVDAQLPPTPPKEQLMERYHSHVEQCRSCRGALKGFRILQAALFSSSFLILAGLALRAVTQKVAMAPPAAVPWVVLSGLCLAAAAWLGKFMYEKYFFSDYVHALVK